MTAETIHNVDMTTPPAEASTVLSARQCMIPVERVVYGGG